MKSDKKLCGIYMITLSNGKRYIGQSVDILGRVDQHNKCHYTNQVVSYEILILCSKQALDYHERRFIWLLNPELNKMRYEGCI